MPEYPMNNNQKNEVKIEPYENGVEITFPIITLPQNKFNAIMSCLKVNRESGKIIVESLVCDKNNILHIIVKGIDGFVEQFTNLVRYELLVAEMMPYPDPVITGVQEIADLHRKIEIPITLSLN